MKQNYYFYQGFDNSFVIGFKKYVINIIIIILIQKCMQQFSDYISKVNKQRNPRRELVQSGPGSKEAKIRNRYIMF